MISGTPKQTRSKTTQFPDRLLAWYPSDKQSYNDQTRSFHPVLSVIVRISDVWSSQCPIYENIVIQGETSNTRRLAKIGKGKLQMKWSSSSSITVNETEFSPCYIALKKRELTNNIGRCVTKRGTDYLAPRANRAWPGFPNSTFQVLS